MTESPVTLIAEHRLRVATAQVLRFDIPNPSESTFRREGSYWLDLSLTPRPPNTRARYRGRWSPHRFERVGSLFILPDGEALQFRTEGGRQTSIVCQLHPEPSQAWFDIDLKWADSRLDMTLRVSDGNIRNLLQQLARELLQPGFAKELLVELVVGQIAIEVERFRISNASNNSAGLSPWRLRLIEDRVTSTEEAPSLTELANLCNMSVRNLTRGFRTSRGCSLGEYVAMSRVDLAKKMLVEGTSIRCIAKSLGFPSASSFTHAFRRCSGVTPREFRTFPTRMR